MTDLAPPAAGTRYFVAGTVRRVHGIRGELAVELHTDHPGRVFRPGRKLVVGNATDEPTNDQLTVEGARPFKGGILLKTREHSGLSEAIERLRGRSLLIPETAVAPLETDEVFYHDLVGLRVVAGRSTVGTVRSIIPAPASDLLSVRRENGRELLVPYVREVVRAVRVEEGVIEIEPPPGLLDL